MESLSESLDSFLRTTCTRNRYPDVRRIYSVMYYAIQLAQRDNALKHDPDVHIPRLFPLTSGSVSEFYIKPVASCIGDVDIMVQYCDVIVVPQGQPVPEELPPLYEDEINVCHWIESEFPGYGFLLLTGHLIRVSEFSRRYSYTPCEKKTYFGRYSTSYDESLEGPAYKQKVTEAPLLNVVSDAFHSDEATVDLVFCLHCLEWPPQAHRWKSRTRSYGWPDPATVDRVVQVGCDFVQVAPKNCDLCECRSKRQWRLSFSRAETVLLHIWTLTQQIVYHLLRYFAKSRGLESGCEQCGRKVLSNYHLKTTMMWACERKPPEWWETIPVTGIMCQLLRLLAKWLHAGEVKNYFVPKSNIYIANHFRRETTDALIYRLNAYSEADMNVWFIDKYLRNAVQRCTPQDIVVTMINSIEKTIMKTSESRNVSEDESERRLEKLEDNTLSEFLSTLNSFIEWDAINSIDTYVRRSDQVIGSLFSVLELICGSALTCSIAVSDIERIDPVIHTALVGLIMLHFGRKLHDDDARIDCETVDTIMAALMVADGTSIIRVEGDERATTMIRKAVDVVAGFEHDSTMNVGAERRLRLQLCKIFLRRSMKGIRSPSNPSMYLAEMFLAAIDFNTGHYTSAVRYCNSVISATASSSHLETCHFDVDLLPVGVLDNEYLQGIVKLHMSTKEETQHDTLYDNNFTAAFYARYIKRMCRMFEAGTENIAFVTKRMSKLQKNLNSKSRVTTADVILYSLLVTCCRITKRLVTARRGQRQVREDESETKEFEELLIATAVEKLTNYRVLLCGSLPEQSTWNIVIDDFQALNLYRTGDYTRCLRISQAALNRTIGASAMIDLATVPPISFLMDNDINCIIGLAMLCVPDPEDPKHYSQFGNIRQVVLCLYLVVQCVLRLKKAGVDVNALRLNDAGKDINELLLKELAVVDALHSRPWILSRTFDCLVLKFIYRKAMLSLIG